MTEWQEVEALQSTCQGSAGFLLVSEGRSSAIACEGGKAFDVHRSLFPNCFEPTRRMPLRPQPLDHTSLPLGWSKPVSTPAEDVLRRDMVGVFGPGPVPQTAIVKGTSQLQCCHRQHVPDFSIYSPDIEARRCKLGLPMKNADYRVMIACGVVIVASSTAALL